MFLPKCFYFKMVCTPMIVCRVQTESQVEDTAFEETTRDVSKFGKLIIISLKRHLNDLSHCLQNSHRQRQSFRFKRGMT